MTNRRRFLPLLVISMFTTFMGFMAFTGVANNPRFESYRTVDVIRLMAAGGNFAVAFVALILFFVRPDFRSPTWRTKDAGTRGDGDAGKGIGVDGGQ